MFVLLISSEEKGVAKEDKPKEEQGKDEAPRESKPGAAEAFANTAELPRNSEL